MPHLYFVLFIVLNGLQVYSYVCKRKDLLQHFKQRKLQTNCFRQLFRSRKLNDVNREAWFFTSLFWEIKNSFQWAFLYIDIVNTTASLSSIEKPYFQTKILFLYSTTKKNILKYINAWNNILLIRVFYSDTSRGHIIFIHFNRQKIFYSKKRNIYLPMSFQIRSLFGRRKNYTSTKYFPHDWGTWVNDRPNISIYSNGDAFW